MSNDESLTSGGAGARRVPRQGMGGSPVGSTLSIVLAVVAVVAGFLILQNITDTGSSSGSGDPGADLEPGAVDSTVPDSSVVGTETTSTTTSTTVAKVTDGATVLVANVNTVGGSAGSMTKTLELAGYTMADPTNGSGPNIDDTVVYFDGTVAAAQDVANSVARDLGNVSVLPVPTPPPTESGELGGAGVLVMLGNNQAGKTIEELQASAATADGPSTAEAPAVAGSDDATADTTPTDSPVDTTPTESPVDTGAVDEG